MIYFTNESPFNDFLIIPVSLALFHSLFNIINTLIVFQFSDYLLLVANKLVRNKDNDQETFGLKFINTGFLSTSELSILQVSKEIESYAKKSHLMFGILRKLFFEINENDFQNLLAQLKRYHIDSHNTEQEIMHYLTRLSESDLSLESSLRIRMMLKLIDETENTCNGLYNMAKILKRKRKKKIWFTQDIRDNINMMFLLLEKAYEKMILNLSNDYEQADIDNALQIEKEINKYRKELHKNHLKNAGKSDYKHEAGIVYNDIFNKCERLGDYIYNVSKTLSDIKSF